VTPAGAAPRQTEVQMASRSRKDVPPVLQVPRGTTALIFGAVFLTALPVGALLAMFFALGGEAESEVRLGILLGGVVSLVLLLLIAAGVLFTFVNLGDREQALGLPKGSVRALIAIFLVLMFSIVGIFVFRMMAQDEGGSGDFEGLTLQEVETLRSDGGSIDIEPDDVEEGAERTFSGSITEPLSEDARQLAFTLTTILGTLVTAVAAFYFGAQSVKASVEAMQPLTGRGAVTVAPQLTSINPPTGAAGAAVDVTLVGTDLGGVATVRLTRASPGVLGAMQRPDVIEARDVTISATLIRCSFDIPAGAATGAWSVEALGSDGAATLTDGFTVT
jgi:hypothetical protein